MADQEATPPPQVGPLQLFKPLYRVDEVLSEIRDCLEIGWTGSGYKTLEFEEEWKRYTGLPHAHFVNSATSALHLAVRALGLSRGWLLQDEVITTPMTFVSTNHALMYEGLKPVFADVDDYLCLDPDSVERHITDKTRAVMFVGLGGGTGQLERIVDICRKHSLALILDAAHMAGTRLRGQDPGHLADATCYSFQAVKNLPTADSGAVCFIDPEMDAVARKLSWLGIDKDTYSRSEGGAYAWQYSVDHVGYKYHGNSIMAAMAKVALRYLDDDNMHRRAIKSVYASELTSKGFTVVPTPGDCESSTHLIQVLVENRSQVIQALQLESVFPGVHYRTNTDYPMYAYGRGSCPNAEHLSDRILSLPNHLQVTQDEAVRISKIVTQSGVPAEATSQ